MTDDKKKSAWTTIVDSDPTTFAPLDTPVLIIEYLRHIPVVASVSWKLVWADSQNREELNSVGVVAWMPLPPAYKEEEKP